MPQGSAREIGDITVGELMSKPARTVRPETTINTVWAPASRRTP
jgi:hypothetical protein